MYNITLYNITLFYCFIMNNNWLKEYQSKHYLVGDIFSSRLNLFRINRKYYIYEKSSSKYCAIVRHNWITRSTNHFFIEC